jgi:hypothetical protein
MRTDLSASRQIGPNLVRSLNQVREFSRKRDAGRNSGTWFKRRTRFREVAWATVLGNDARQVIAFGAGRYAFMSARSMVKLDTNAGKPSLTPLH